MSQKGRHIGDIVLVLNMENLSYQKHCYWPCNIYKDYTSFYSDIYISLSHTHTHKHTNTLTSFPFSNSMLLVSSCFPLVVQLTRQVCLINQ